MTPAQRLRKIAQELQANRRVANGLLVAELEQIAREIDSIPETPPAETLSP